MNKNKDSYRDNTTGNIIDLNNVFKEIRNKNKKFVILKNINLKIKKGAFLVVIGKSGSGKTTLMNVMSGMTKISSGEVIVANNDISNYKNSQLINFRQKNVSFIFQEYGLLSTLNVLDNINAGLFLSNDRISKLKMDQIIKSLNLEDHLKKMPNELSGGQQQRVSIARALAKNPKIIFGDEPTGALDSYTSYNVLKILKEINEEGTTIILVTHDSRIAKIATHIIEILDGKVISNYENKPLINFKKLFV